MVGAPTKFRVDVTTNQGRLANITLKNNNTGSTDVYDCKGSSICEGVVQDTPTKSTFNGTGYSIVSDRYKITIYPENNGDTTVINNPRGAGDKVYNESDVSNLGTNGLGNVTVKDVDAVLQNTGAETGELPWDNPVDARYDVNNDGVVDIVDATAVAQDW
jgi:hypothetical protein